MREIKQSEEEFDRFVYHQSEKWTEFYEYWMDVNRKIPVYIVKYEDLIKNPKKTLNQVFKYLLGWTDNQFYDSLIAMLIELIDVDQQPVDKKHMYELEEDQLEYVTELAEQLLPRLEYDLSLNNENNTYYSTLPSFKAYHGKLYLQR